MPIPGEERNAITSLRRIPLERLQLKVEVRICPNVKKQHREVSLNLVSRICSKEQRCQFLTAGVAQLTCSFQETYRLMAPSSSRCPRTLIGGKFTERYSGESV